MLGYFGIVIPRYHIIPVITNFGRSEVVMIWPPEVMVHQGAFQLYKLYIDMEYPQLRID